ncbi:HD domain-containing protein [Curtobacterium sp. MCBD17_040]|uniref:HD domain-containing protein n=1 Tax=Curtobacterium sp. MCBD17_040 TaxID=2175674 RepID=UPI0011B72D5B|nr:HD domain-containing protein [Curtobacterium sp. MCBD17_040]WIB65599.1 HD domain-containing protein [Curtobacterium sp. MCBD17_040]
MTTSIICALCGQQRDVPAVHRCFLPDDVRDDRPDVLELSRHAESLTYLITLAGGTPVIVGGTVRDALIRHFHGSAPQPPKSLDRQFRDTLETAPEGFVRRGGPIAQDVDVEVHDLADVNAMVALLRDNDAVVVEAGGRFPVYKATFSGEHFDISVAQGAYSDDDGLTAAFSCRDVTVNAVSYDASTGEFIDVFGGINDIRDEVLRPTSDRFDEDPLRVLRAVQFVSRYGFTVHPELIDRAQRLSDRFDTIAVERLWPEWKKLTQGVHISAALNALHTLGWERHFPELAAIRNVPQDPHWHPEGPVHVHLGLAGDHAAAHCERDGITGDQRVIVVLAAMLHDLGKAGPGTQHLVQEDGSVRIKSHGHDEYGADAVRALLGRIGAPRHIIDAVAVIVREHMVANSAADRGPSAAAARRLYRRLGATVEMVDAWLRVCDADCQGRGAGSKRTSAYDWAGKMFLAAASTHRPLLTGRHLIDAGLTPGPLFKQILADAVEAQDNGDFNTSISAQAWFREHAADYGITAKPDPLEGMLR